MVAASDSCPAPPAANMPGTGRREQRNAHLERLHRLPVKKAGSAGVLARAALGLALLGLCLSGSGCDSGGDDIPAHTIGEHKWTRDHGGLVLFPVPRPIIEGDIVYACAGRKLLSLDVTDGAVHWREDLGQYARCVRIAHDAQSLYLLVDDQVQALSKRDGSLLWTRGLDSEPQSLAVGDTRVYVGGSGWVSSINTNDGEVDRKISLSQLNPGWAREQQALSIVLADEMMYVTTGHYDEAEGTVKGNVLAYKTATGEYVWGFEGPELAVNSGDLLNQRFYWGMGVSEGVISGNSLIVSAAPAVISLSRSTGRVRWRNFESASYNSGPMATYGNGLALKDGVVYIGSLNSKVYAIDADSGALHWESRGVGGVNASSFVSVDDGKVYYSLTDGSVHVLQVGTGRAMWSGTPPGGGPGGLRILPDPPLAVGSGCMVSVSGSAINCLSAR